MLKKSLKNGYLNYKLKANLVPEIKIGRWLVPLLFQSSRIDESIRHIPKAFRSRIIADIGCGNGQFLQTAIQLGLEAYGLDFDPLAVETATKTGANVSLGGLPNTGWPSSKFDMVTLSHVIEHVYDPMLALREVRRILKPGGLVWIATPNMDSFGHNRYRRYWRGIESPRHLVLFNRTNIKMLLEACGFVNIIDKPCHPQTFWFYKTSLEIKKRKEGNGLQMQLMGIITQYKALIANIMERYMPSKCENLVIMAENPYDE
ncbi:MAG: class I SAM-dependent methyltransferase [Acidithiobacillus sp.]|nr:class I SAM-dependent methyltransferase [Acidithiobacillus sp.]